MIESFMNRRRLINANNEILAINFVIMNKRNFHGELGL